MADNRAVEIPRENRYPGDIRQIGFTAQPDTGHIEAAAQMLRSLAAAADGGGAPDGEPLRVCLTLARLPLGLPLNLFGFHLVGVKDGEVIDKLLPEVEILYALIVNQPVALLRDVAIRFLLDVITRTGPIRQVRQDRQPLAELPRMIESSHAAVTDLSWDLPPESTQALAAVGERAAEAGIALHVRFTPDPFPSHDQLATRMPALRTLYNEESHVRDAVDRTVSLVGARDGSMRGGREDVRSFLRQQYTLAGMRQFFNQVVRDAEVCGNGYLHHGLSGLDAQPRCLRPESVEPRTDGAVIESTSEGPLIFPAEEILHLRGIEQIASPYGISILEPFLYVRARRRIAQHTRAMWDQLPVGAPEQVKLATRELLHVASAIEAETEQRLNQLLATFSTILPDASEDLYFPGQELMR